MPYSLTRQEMLDLLWSTPRAAVLEKLGISEVQLGLICGFHRIPRPTKAYWAQKEKGENLPRPALPPIADPWRELITDRPRRFEDMPFVLQGVAPEPVAEGAEQASKQVSVAKSPPTPTPARIPEPAPAPQQKPARRGSNRTQRTAPWGRVRRPHALLAGTVRNLYRSKPVDGVVSTTRPDLHLRLGVGSLDRAIFILDALVRRLEKRGARISIDGECLEVAKEHHRLRVRLREKFESVPYVPTSREVKQDRELEWLRRRLLPAPAATAVQRFVDQPTGELSLGVELTAGSLDRRQNWRDNKYAALEAQLDDVVLGLETWLDDLRAEEAAARRQVRLERRAQENEGRAEARKKRDRQRTGFLLEVVERAVTAEKMRAWLSAVGEPEEPETKRMIAWAREEITRIEGSLAPKRFAAEIQRRELFPEVDPLAPLPDDPDA